MRLNVCLAALAATFLAATPAMAATSATASAQARGIVLQSLSLSWVKDLDFGTVAGDPVGGDVVIDPDTGVRSVTGAIVPMPGAYSRAQFDGFGEKNVPVTLSLSQPAGGVICNGPSCANQIGAVLALDQAGSTSRSTGSTGAFTVNVGGTFTLAGGQAAGLYTAQFDLTAVYP